MAESPSVTFGRADVCTRIAQAFERGARLVTITGPGGMGKTRVARDVAPRIAPKVSVVAFGALSAAGDRTSVARAVAKVTGVRLSTAALRSQPAADVLAAALSEHADTLLVLDDVDRLLGETARIAQSCLGLEKSARLLVTSREALGIDGETVIRLGPLDEEAALSMFLARAETEGLPEDDVRQLVGALEGLPLAIELAARRTPLLSPSAILARWQQRLRLLRAERRDAPARHTTLADTFEWSWELLDQDEQRAFAGMATTTGPVSLETFEAMLGPSLSRDPIDVADALLRKSLIERVKARGAVHLTMLETVRAFAAEKLAALDERAAIETRSVRHFLERADEALSMAYGPRAARAFDTLEADLPHLTSLLEGARLRAEEPAVFARITLAVGELGLAREVLDLRAPWFADARAAADQAQEPVLAARTRILYAKVLLEIGTPEDAQRELHRAIELANGDVELSSQARRSLGWAKLAAGNVQDAQTELKLAFEGHRASGDVRGQADALAALGMCGCLSGALADGHASLQAAHELHVRSGDTVRRAKVAEMADFVGLQLEGAAKLTRAELLASAEAHAARGQHWREALDRFRLAELDKSAPASSEAKPAPAALAWSVGPEARWLEPPQGERVDLMRHGSLRRVLDALTERRLARPGEALSADALLDTAWPGEKILHDAGMLRVYTAIRRLRKLGLGSMVITRDDGYLLDPSVDIRRADGA
jgi:predicted ATPase